MSCTKTRQKTYHIGLAIHDKGDSMIEECIPKWAGGFALTSVGIWFLVNAFITLHDYYTMFIISSVY